MLTTFLKNSRNFSDYFRNCSHQYLKLFQKKIIRKHHASCFLFNTECHCFEPISVHWPTGAFAKKTVCAKILNEINASWYNFDRTGKLTKCKKGEEKNLA